MAWVPAAHAVVTVSQGPPKSKAHGHRGRRGVGHHHRHEEGRDAVGPLDVQHGVLVEDGLQSANARGHDAARVLEGTFEPALRHASSAAIKA